MNTYDPDAPDVHVTEDANGFKIHQGARIIYLDIPDALALISMLSVAVNGRLLRPYSNEDPSTILSRGESR